MRQSLARRAAGEHSRENGTIRERDLQSELDRSGYAAPGFAEHYDAVRPRPPEMLLELLPSWAGVGRPRLVVDLGSGTGLSTRAWAGRADEVVGVEPSGAMRRQAAVTDASGVRYVDGSSYATGLADGSADLVTCAQSLQWMEPAATFAEVARILRPAGVFAAFEYQSLQTPFWQPERAWFEMREAVARLREERGLDREKAPLAGVAQAAGAGRMLRRVPRARPARHRAGNGDRLVGLALSAGSVTTLLADGAREDELGLDRLREVVARTIGTEPCPWLLGYRVWIGRRRGAR
jgi:ubiquinone/menaquinone biosynthesis C-methylase UbiE